MSRLLERDQPVTNLPYVERRTRLIFDTLRFNGEAAQAAYLRLSDMLKAIYDRERAATGGVDVGRAELSLLFSDAWTVIRSCHSIFEIICKEEIVKLDIPSVDLKHGTAISKIRNKMDHIAGNIGNYARRMAKPMPPLLGILTACFVLKCEKGAFVEILEAIALSHSDFHHKIDVKAFPDEDELFPFSGWIDHVRIHAFDDAVDLSKVADFVERLLAGLTAAYLGPEPQRLNVVISMRRQAPFTVA